MISSAILIVIGLLIWLAVRKIFRSYEAKKRQEMKNKVVRTPGLVAYRAFEYILLALIVTGVLQVNGINMSSLITGLGVAGIIVGYSLQNIIQDVIMGLHIQTDHFYQVGDVIKVDDVEGVVTDFTIQTTKIYSSIDNSTVSICNRNITQVSVVSTFNYVDVPLSYSANLPEVREAMKTICARVEELDGISRCEFKGTSSFGDSAINYRVNFYTRPEKRFEMKRRVLGVIQEVLGEAGLEIPFNQMDLHIGKVTEDAPAKAEEA